MNPDPIQTVVRDIGDVDMREFEQGFQLGWETCYPLAHAAGVADEAETWQAIVTGWAQTWRRPDYADLVAKREEVVTTPCRTRCRSCSRCLRFVSWHSRGGRDYLGADREQALARRVA